MRYSFILFGTAMLMAQTSSVTPEESEVMRLMNEARVSPARFARQYIRPRVGGNPDAAECYGEMIRMRPVQALRISSVLMHSARDHAIDSGRSGRMGHTGAGGTSVVQRIERYGQWEGSVSENLYYGPNDPVEMVVQLLIDEGVPGRGHRRNILNPATSFTGVAIRPHRSLGYNCVIDFASRITGAEVRLQSGYVPGGR